ncbi:MAG: T9SS type A sorting domain-containing protein [Candidatus Kapabacteria bacterium]|nr:T9SS type A sorting domain-containing protein [Candidatus Kapabacteria bacterium]
MKRILLLTLVALGCTLTAIAQTPRLITPAGGEKYRPGTSQDLVWDTTGTFRARWRFQFGTSPAGPWTDFLDVVDSANRRGIFAGGFRVPGVRTTTGYVRMVLLVNGVPNENSTSRNQEPFEIEQPVPVRADSVLRTPITTTLTLSNTKIYSVDGYVFVDNGGVLRIEPGTIITGDTVGQNSALCVNRGGKIYANGTKDMPIIMTSSAPPGQRAPGDWGGLLICGRARTNHPGGEAAMEGGIADDATTRTRGWFGGNDDDDSSGVVRYVRIEFAGIAAASNSELNSLTMGGVGRKTVVEYVQCSFGNDDSFEWFGGAVNAKYLISTGCLDDDFDTDNGFSGMIQFGLSQRLKSRADQSTSQAFESDNDANASFNQPLTSCVFSNMTCIGPIQDTSWTSSATGLADRTFHSRFGAAAQIRRNSRMSLYNSVLIGYPRGIEIANANTMAAANNDSLHVRNSSWYGVKNTVLNFAGGTPPSGMTTDWIAKGQFNNVVDKESPMNAKLENPFATTIDLNPMPKSDAPYLTTASFDRNGIIGIDNAFFTRVAYRGAFGGNIVNRWDLGWTEYDPVNKEYKPFIVSVDEEQTQSGITGGVAFPNPASEATTIRYDVRRAARTSISITNALGVELALMGDAAWQDAGIYEITLNTASLASGMYFARITTPTGVTTIPFTVVR